MCVFVCVCECMNVCVFEQLFLCVCICKPVLTGRIWHKVNFSFLTGFPSPRPVAQPRQKKSFCPIIYSSLRQNNWIHTFPKGISAT